MRYLTDSLPTLNVNSIERAAILNIRQVVDHLSKSEMVTLVSLLIHSYSAPLERWITIQVCRSFNKELTTARIQLGALPPAAKVGIAIELLKLIEAQNRDEAEQKLTASSLERGVDD
jgi:hypothetical protein